jgi:hypothetical protein
MIIRHAERRKWATVDRRVVNDATLSFRARGVIVWLLDKPDGWEVRSTAIAAAGTEGRDAVRTALRELEIAGYITRARLQLDDGRWVTETTIYECPCDNPIAQSEADSLPKTDSQASVDQPSGDRSSGTQAVSPSELKLMTDASDDSSEDAAAEPVEGDVGRERIEAIRSQSGFARRSA